MDWQCDRCHSTIAKTTNMALWRRSAMAQVQYMAHSSTSLSSLPQFRCVAVSPSCYAAVVNRRSSTLFQIGHRGNSMKMVRRIQKINFCDNYVTGITGKLIICTLFCKKNYMVIYIRIDFVDIWIQARTWMRLEKTLLPNSSEVVRVK